MNIIKWDEEALIKFVESYNGKIDGVITIASDIPHMVSRVAERIGVRHISIETADLAVDKFKMKQALKYYGVNVPEFRMVLSAHEVKKFIKEFGFPVIIKPIDNSGARGVLMITEDTDLEWAYKESKNNSRSGEIMIEKFISGQQISTEGIMYENQFYITGFSDRNYSRLEEFLPNIIEDGGDFPSILSNEQVKLVNIEFEKAVRALGIDWGPGKGDMIYGDDEKAYVVEIAARLSGGNFCYDQVPLGTGVDIVDAYIDMAVGNSIDIECFKPKFSKGIAQRYFFPGTGKIKEILGIEEVKSMTNVAKIDFFVKEGDIIEKQSNHTKRVGYVIAVGKDKKEAIKNAEEAINSVRFIFD